LLPLSIRKKKKAKLRRRGQKRKTGKVRKGKIS